MARASQSPTFVSVKLHITSKGTAADVSPRQALACTHTNDFPIELLEAVKKPCSELIEKGYADTAWPDTQGA